MTRDRGEKWLWTSFALLLVAWGMARASVTAVADWAWIPALTGVLCALVAVCLED